VIGRIVRSLSVAAVGLLAVDVLGILVLVSTTPSFASTFNLFVLLRDIAVTLLIALAQMVVLAIGQMNLSVGAIGGLVTVIMGWLMAQGGVPVAPAIVLALLLGAATGAVNGSLVLWTKLNSFILTLATGFVFLGMNQGLTKGIPFYRLPEGFAHFGQARAGLFPYLAIVTLVLTVALAVFFRWLVLGRQMLAVGGNRRAAELSGLPVGRVVMGAHVLSGLLAGTAAILLTAQLGEAEPTVGQTWLLPSFAGPIIGGAALTGGTAPIFGTFLGVVLISLIDDGLILRDANPFWIQFLVGALILGAVILGRVQLRGLRAGEALRRLRSGTSPTVGEAGAPR
jgi:ribose transport system permease protein